MTIESPKRQQELRNGWRLGDLDSAQEQTPASKVDETLFVAGDRTGLLPESTPIEPTLPKIQPVVEISGNIGRELALAGFEKARIVPVDSIGILYSNGSAMVGVEIEDENPNDSGRLFPQLIIPVGSFIDGIERFGMINLPIVEGDSRVALVCPDPGDDKLACVLEVNSILKPGADGFEFAGDRVVGWLSAMSTSLKENQRNNPPNRFTRFIEKISAENVSNGIDPVGSFEKAVRELRNQIEPKTLATIEMAAHSYSESNPVKQWRNESMKAEMGRKRENKLVPVAVVEKKFKTVIFDKPKAGEATNKPVSQLSIREAIKDEVKRRIEAGLPPYTADLIILAAESDPRLYGEDYSKEKTNKLIEAYHDIYRYGCDVYSGDGKTEIAINDLINQRAGPFIPKHQDALFFTITIPAVAVWTVTFGYPSLLFGMPFGVLLAADALLGSMFYWVIRRPDFYERDEKNKIQHKICDSILDHFAKRDTGGVIKGASYCSSHFVLTKTGEIKLK